MLTSEEDGAHLVKAKVHRDGVYQRQQGTPARPRAASPRAHAPTRSHARAHADTILSWNEPETGVDYALSFQEADGCTEVWEQICALQGRAADEAPVHEASEAAHVVPVAS